VVVAAIWMLSQGQALAQLPQPVQSSGRMKTSPSGSRPIAPVGQSIMQAAFLHCWQVLGRSRLAGPLLAWPRTLSRVTTLSPRLTRRLTPCTSAQLQAQWPQRTHWSWSMTRSERAICMR
jgi:hypothetical protein